MIEELIRPFNSHRPRSSWVQKVGFGIVTGHDEPGVIVKFNNREDQFGAEHPGPFCFYPGTTEEDYDALLASESWGRYIWDHFYHRDYEIV